MSSRVNALRLATQTTPRYCDHCGSMNLWTEHHETVDLFMRGRARRYWDACPAWECAVCHGLTVLTLRAAKRQRSLDRKPSFVHKWRKVVIDTRKLVP